MTYLLLGSDDFSKKEFIAGLQQQNNKAKLEVVSFFEYSDLNQILNIILNENLFGQGKIIKLYDFFASSGLSAEEIESFIAKISKSLNAVIFIEQKLDKRKSETKKLLANKQIKVLEFNLPEAAEFRKWAEQRAKKYALKLNPAAFEILIQRLAIDKGDFGAALYDLWQADSELSKLAAFAAGKEVSAAEVSDLVSENTDDNIFKITNAIGDKNKELAMRYMVDYMDRFAGSDEKTKVIGLSGLLADQFRGILMIQDLVAKRFAPEQISEQTGFSSGRIFIFKKLAQRFTQQKLLEALKKLELLDQEIKTSQNPAALQFFMIIDSVMK